MTTKEERETIINKIDSLTEDLSTRKSIINRIKETKENEDLLFSFQLDQELLERNIQTLKDWIINDKIDW